MGDIIPSEKALLSAFLASHFAEPDIRRDVRLGKIADLEHGKYLSLLLRKADAIVILSDWVYIIEAKVKPDPEAVGQLLFYRYLFADTPEFQHLSLRPIHLIFVTTMVDEDLRNFCTGYAIEYCVQSVS